MNTEHKRLAAILIHTTPDRDDMPRSEHLQNGNATNWIEVIVGWWAVIAIIVFSIWS